MRFDQRVYAWMLLGLCLASIPCAFISQKDNDKDNSSSSGFMSKFNDHIQVVRLSGMIIDKTEAGLLSSKTGASMSVLKELKEALKDENTKAVLLRINSPGGTVPTSQELHQAVVNLKKAGKPVVISMGDLAASGGYYIACAGDKIYANPGTLTGSIGVIMNLMNFKDLTGKIGVNPVTIKSGKFKDIASPYREMTPEDREILTNLIMDSYDQFTRAVADGRKMPLDKVKTLADGRIYSGRQAKKVGLVDELGSMTDALADLQTICRKKYNLDKDLAVQDQDSQSILANLLESRTAIENKLDLQKLLPSQLVSNLSNQPLWLYQ